MDEVIELNSKVLLDEIKRALMSISFGSVEIMVQDGVVTQLTVRKIQKTSLEVSKRTSGNGKAVSKFNVKNSAII